jgi:hypothetical protein
MNFNACSRPECQGTGGCAHRGPLGEACHFPTYTGTPRGCICPPGSEATCKGFGCPRQPFNMNPTFGHQ